MRNPLSLGLIQVARALADLGSGNDLGGGQAARQAAFRRAASSAYYALFHTICQLCGDGLRLWTLGGDDLQQAYRNVDHGRTADVLVAATTRALHADLERIGDAFAELRKLREDADYSQPGRIGAVDKPLTRSEIELVISVAEEAIELVDRLPASVRRRLAVLLLTGLNTKRLRR